jgi:cyclic beta-1,2-glucan synthetase
MEERLREAYEGAATPSGDRPDLLGAAEWLLDNYYIVRRAVRQVHQDLPMGFLRALPVLGAPHAAETPRIYVLATELIGSCQPHEDPDLVRQFVLAYEAVTPLTMAEVWALPAMLRLATLERLVDAASVLADRSVAGDPPPGRAAPPLANEALPGVANGVLTLRALDAEDWLSFFELVSGVDEVLRGDPARVYAHMDFQTRDRYRKTIEALARSTGRPEQAVAQLAVDLAREASQADPDGDRGCPDPPAPASDAERAVPSVADPERRSTLEADLASGAARLFGAAVGHVGFYLLDRGRDLLETRLGYRPSLGARIRRGVAARAIWAYLGAIGAMTLIVLIGVAGCARASDATSAQLALALGLALVPAVTVAVSVVQVVVTHLVPPDVLPKMDFRESVPTACRTLVAIPAMLTTPGEIRGLLLQLEQHYLSAPDPNICFALLTDHVDAPQEEVPGDAALLSQVSDGIRSLNERHGQHEPLPFHLFHRPRAWNPGEGTWMGWERKRGKLSDLLELLSGGPTSSQMPLDPGGPLPGVRYVITLDADSDLTRGGARRLIATMAHPLNQAALDAASGAVIAGYTVLQPRVLVKPTSVNRTMLANIMAGDAALDPYTTAVSDVYQDLFHEGIYVGKGIIDVAAFRRALRGRVPENALLSHDLFEGIVGRTALVSDAVVLEDFPAHYLELGKRIRRWIRGDWQLLPWLLTRVPVEGGGKRPNDLSLLDRWKILDNLRRSLLAPAMLALLICGWFWLPGPAVLWTILGVSTPGVVLFAGLAPRLRPRLPSAPILMALRPLRIDLARWLFALVVLPFEALLSAQAICVTLLRLVITGRGLLQWTPAGQVARTFARGTRRFATWRDMAPAVALTLGVGLLIAVTRPSAMVAAAPLLLTWLAAPAVVDRLSRPRRHGPTVLAADQQLRLRRLARQTWLFYERFVGPEDHWLPPDHFQEWPRQQIAHRTSPTNIGFLLLSTVAAHDLGYVGMSGLALRLKSTIDTIDALEHSRGHLLNWYDTRTLAPLPPRYISTVDSGNLAGCLITAARACTGREGAQIIHWARWQGLLDTISLLDQSLEAAVFEADRAPLHAMLKAIEGQVLAARLDPSTWAALLVNLSGRELPALDGLLMKMIETAAPAPSADALDIMRLGIEGVHRHLRSMRRELARLMPWIALLREPPVAFEDPIADPELRAAWSALLDALPITARLGDVSQVCDIAGPRLTEMRRLVRKRLRAQPAPVEAEHPLRQAEAWCVRLNAALDAGRIAAERLLADHGRLAARAEALVQAMDFGFLLDRRRQVFHIGFNVDTQRLDPNHYDLLASEARLASLVAIAKRDVPQSHWLHMGRPLARVGDTLALLSWSGTMFEYLMPLLLTRHYPDTLLDQTCRAVVLRQEEYARGKGLPWGISESGYYAFDAGMSYQYRAFGVPGLGLKRDLGDDLVVAPYASMLALPIAPDAVLRNLDRLRRWDMVGAYGLYEALDCTPARLPTGESSARVRSYMAHHHGMTLIAIANALQDDIMVRRFHSDPAIQSVELLLQEQSPLRAETDELAPRSTAAARPAREHISLTPWNAATRPATPDCHLLSNGRYSVVITGAGSGFSQWRGFSLSRWRADPTLEDWGTWVYVADRESGSVISPTFLPTAVPTVRQRAVFYPYKAEFYTQGHDLTVKMEVGVGTPDDVEIRHLVLTNDSDRTRRLAVMSCGEVALAPPDADRRHPAFSKLFVASEFLPEINGLLFWRRPSAAAEEPVFLAHLLVGETRRRAAIDYDSDRFSYMGRGRGPTAPRSVPPPEGGLSRNTGATLDPIMALSLDVTLAPHGTARLAFVTVAGASRAGVLASARRYQSLRATDHAFGESWRQVELDLRDQGVSTTDVRCFDHLLSALLFPCPALRADERTIAQNRKGRTGLWGFGISGDYPILLARLSSEAEIPLVQEVVQAHAYWRRRGIAVDAVILVEKESGYNRQLRGEVHRLITRLHGDSYLNQRGGIFLLSSDQMADDDRGLLLAAARAIVDGARGTLADQLRVPVEDPVRLPAFSPTLSHGDDMEATAPLARPGGMQFDNGSGGFSPDGREYWIYLAPGQHTPAPWINVIASPRFGFTVSEVGAGYTWAENSSENRLTPWSNDPVRDTPGEAMYLRDEETGVVWSPTPMPAPAEAPYLVRHGAGYTVFEHRSHGLGQSLRLFLLPDAPVKVVALRLENLWQRPRRVTATYYAQWILGADPEPAMQYLVPEYEGAANALLAHNPYNVEFGSRYAFLASSQPPHGVTADRAEFIGRMGDLRCPSALTRLGLAGEVRAGLDPCAAIQLHVDLAPGEAKEVFFLLGQGGDRDEALTLATRYSHAAQVEAGWTAARGLWRDLLATVTVTTPDPAMDLMVNHWLLYQALACRIWGRSALYQSSGAYGFRDQLQDVMAMVHAAPQVARDHLLLAARHQFEEGDVLHWWHPPLGRGVRTRCADDMLWLPYVTAHYVATTGDSSVLDERVPFVTGPPLEPEETERFGLYPATAGSETLYEHCRRAINKGLTAGAHGLPLIGTGDWNDGLNRVGRRGRGESIWMAWFLHATLVGFAPMAEVAGAPDQATAWRKQAERVRVAVEAAGWDGGWYRRAYDDDGQTLGAAGNREWLIDSVAQSWAVLSGAADPERAAKAMRAVKAMLVDRDHGLILLARPPFDKSNRDPGYIKGYPPGVRENGGAYHHAAIWAAWAMLELGWADDGHALFQMLNPINRSATPKGVDCYKVEPYVVAADVSNSGGHLGRGGWTWYTGSAAWMYRLALEGMLGLRRRGDVLQIKPCIPSSWPGFQVSYGFGRSRYRIEVTNVDGVTGQVREIRLDGQVLPAGEVPLRDDGGEHEVSVVMGQVIGHQAT